MNKNIDKIKKGRKVANTKIWIGGFFAISAFSLLIDYINAGESLADIIIDIFIILTLVAIVTSGIMQIRLINKCDKYVSILLSLSSNEKISINRFEELTKTPKVKLIENIEKMINKGYIYGTYIDLNTQEVVFSNNNIQKNSNLYDNVQSIKCQNCGGMNSIIKENKVECEYCGSIIKN